MGSVIAGCLNILGEFCGMRDLEELTVEQLRARYGIDRVDVMVLFGGSILCGGDVLARAMKDGIAEKYVIVGGGGHTTDTLRRIVQSKYPSIRTDGMPEADVYSRYLKLVYGLEVDYLERESTNCGNNITNLLELLKRNGVAFRSILLCQDATMQRRMDAGMRKYIGDDVILIHYASYKAEVIENENQLVYSSDMNGMWDMDRYLELLMGEIPRLRDDAGGYGPKGRNYIAHVDIPDEVNRAYEELVKVYGERVREGNPVFASK